MNGGKLVFGKEETKNFQNYWLKLKIKVFMEGTFENSVQSLRLPKHFSAFAFAFFKNHDILCFCPLNPA